MAWTVVDMTGPMGGVMSKAHRGERLRAFGAALPADVVAELDALARVDRRSRSAEISALVEAEVRRRRMPTSRTVPAQDGSDSR